MLEILPEEGSAFDNILLRPRYSAVLPHEVDLHTHFSKNIAINIPFVSSPMDTVTEYKMAIALALHGGIGVIHRDMDIERQVDNVHRVKRYQSGLITKPYTLTPDKTVADARRFVHEKGISGIPIVQSENDNTLVGLLTRRDLFYMEQDESLPIAKVMKPFEKLVIAPETISIEEAHKVLSKHHIEKLPLVDGNNRLRGLITLKDINLKRTFPFATRDDKERLRVAAAIGAVGDFYERAMELMRHDVDALVIDSSHGHSENVLHALTRLKKTSGMADVVVGNIATAEAAQDLIDAGADGLRVGIGGGSICTTRVVTGVGALQMSAIKDVARVAHAFPIPVIADGGIRYSGDVTKSLAAGAHAVMIGKLFAGFDESPGEIEEVNGVQYKQYRGMGSEAVLKKGQGDRYGAKAVPEGVEALVPYHGMSFEKELSYLVGGVRQGMGYLGCKTISDMHTEKITAQIINAEGIKESHPHDVLLKKNPPNYRIV